MDASSKPLYQPWNEEEFQADVFVRGMTWLQRHLYRSLLCAAFFHGTRPYLPNDDEVLWVLAGAESKDMWKHNKEMILKRFTICDHNTNLLENKRVTADWKRLDDARQRMSELGQKSAAVKKAFNGSSTHVERTSNVRVLTVDGGATHVQQDIVSEVEVKKDTESESASVSVSSHRSADWKNIALRHKRYFGKKQEYSSKTNTLMHVQSTVRKLC